MKSMTGYGEAAHLVRGTKIAVQIRSLNHRHLDLQLRVPREYLAFEEEIRKTIRERILRGRIDVFINRLPGKGQGHRLEVDEELLDQYLQAIKRAKKKYRLSGDVDVSLFARLPDLQGLANWTYLLEHGASLQGVASGFVTASAS